MKTNKYLEMNKKHQNEVDNFPFMFAFNNKQFKDGMKKWGLKETDTNKIYSLGAGSFVRKSDAEKMDEMINRQYKALMKLIYDL